MTTDSVQWPREIRRHTLRLIALVALFGLVTTGYVLWEKRRTEDLLLVIDGFHLASAFHSTAAREETRRILAYFRQDPATAAEAGSTGDLEPDTDFNLVVSLRLVRDRIDAMLGLQGRFADPRFTFLAEKMRREFAVIERESGGHRTSAEASVKIMRHLQSLMMALNQLERLHVIIYEELAAEHEQKKNRSVFALFAFVLVVFGVGFLSVRKGLLAIEAVIVDQSRAEVRLLEAKADAEAANAAKSEFLASMSHELRTPLNSVLGFSQLLSSTLFSHVAERRMEYAKDIQKAGEHLLALIEDILDLSKIESGEDMLAETEFDVSEVLEDAYRMVQGLAKRKAVTVKFDVERHLPQIYADKRRVTQVIVNLLSNAIKFNKTGGSVRLLAATGPGNALMVSVRDSGIGIPASEVSKVFEPFGQVRGSSQLTHEGTGLGLSLSKKLTELHGGTIKLESELDVGTTVTILFPPERTIHRKLRA